MEHEPPTVQYFALVPDCGTAEDATGLVRRIHTQPMPTDEVFQNDLEWHPSEYLRLYRLGHNDQQHVEVNAEFAAQLLERWRARAAARAATNESDVNVPGKH